MGCGTNPARTTSSAHWQPIPRYRVLDHATTLTGMNVYLLYHVSHLGRADGVHRDDGELRIDEQAGDDVKLLGCYSTAERASDRTDRARLLPGFANEPDCFMVDRHEVDTDSWSVGFVVVYD